jgi:MFS family permease
VNAYLRIVRVPRLGPLLGASLLARLPIGINGLAVVLFLRAQTGSFAVAGAAAGGLALGAGLGAPVGARFIDRFGPQILLGLAAGHAAGLLALIALGRAHAPTAALVATSVATGTALPPTSSVLRALYPRLLEDDPGLVQGAFALDSVLTEMIFIAGPLLTAALVALVGPEAALVLSAAAVVAGAALFLAALPPRAPAGAVGGPAPGRLGALRSPGIRTLVIAMVPVGIALGAVEVAVPAFADSHGRRELAGVLIAVWSVGSAAGGIVYGARPRRGSLADTHVRIALLMPLGFVPAALAGSIASMAVLIIPAGVFIAPMLATRNELAGTVAPVGAETEAYSWPLTALVGGVAIGAALGGALADAHGWRTAVVLGVATSALGAAMLLARRRTLAPVPASTVVVQH